MKNVVLVHGGFVDGSGWEGVDNALRKDGYTVAIVPYAEERREQVSLRMVAYWFEYAPAR